MTETSSLLSKLNMTKVDISNGRGYKGVKEDVVYFDKESRHVTISLSLAEQLYKNLGKAAPPNSTKETLRFDLYEAKGMMAFCYNPTSGTLIGTRVGAGAIRLSSVNLVRTIKAYIPGSTDFPAWVSEDCVFIKPREMKGIRCK